MSRSYFARQLKKRAVDLPYTPAVSIATGQFGARSSFQ